MESYFDMFMQNHKYSTGTSSEEPTFEKIIIKSKGGDPNNDKDVYTSVATGSFPPIYIVTKEQIEKEKQTKDRVFAKNKKSKTPSAVLSIKDIMNIRANDDGKGFMDL